MRRVLATKDSRVFCHLRLNKGVTHARAYRLTAVLGDDFRHRLGGNEVMDDGLAGEFLQVALCNQGTNRRR